MDKGLPTIIGSRETDVGAAAIPKATLLEGGNDRAANGKIARLNFGLVLTGFVVERIAADLDDGLSRGETRCVSEPPGCECEREGCDECQESESDRDAHSPAMPGNSCHK